MRRSVANGALHPRGWAPSDEKRSSLVASRDTYPMALLPSDQDNETVSVGTGR
jgi:hypothetical protein